jgi:hypothetical protein
MLSIGLFTQGMLTEARKLNVEDDFGISGSTADQTIKIWINRERMYGMEVEIRIYHQLETYRSNWWEQTNKQTIR